MPEESARWAEIEARRAAGKPRYVLRQRVGMPRGVQPVRRREGQAWVIAVAALLALWGVWFAVTL